MGGTTEPIANALKDSYAENADLADAVRIAVNALRAGSSNGGDQPSLGVSMLEVAILDANRPRRVPPDHGVGAGGAAAQTRCVLGQVGFGQVEDGRLVARPDLP